MNKPPVGHLTLAGKQLSGLKPVVLWPGTPSLTPLGPLTFPVITQSGAQEGDGAGRPWETQSSLASKPGPWGRWALNPVSPTTSSLLA